jgi:hypothetical protein
VPVSGRVNDVHGAGSVPAGAVTAGHARRQPPVQIEPSTGSLPWVYTGSCAGLTKVELPRITAVAKGTLTAGAGVEVGVADAVAVADAVGVADGVALGAGVGVLAAGVGVLAAGVGVLAAGVDVGTEGYRFVEPVQAVTSSAIAAAPRETKSRVVIDPPLREVQAAFTLSGNPERTVSPALQGLRDFSELLGVA